jgi:multidrug efflux pump subunit AcrB
MPIADALAAGTGMLKWASSGFAEISLHLLRPGRLYCVSRRVGDYGYAGGHLSRDQLPVVSVIWQYTGLSVPEMEQRVTTYSQYSISTNVTGIKNMEAQTLNGISVQKIFFQPDVNLDLASSQIVSATNSVRAVMPVGIQPPIVVQYNASSVPVLQLSLASDRFSEQQLYDYGLYNLRQQLAPVPGVTFPSPDGGKYRQITVDIDPLKLQAEGLTHLDVVNAVNAQNLTLPSGLAKIGDTQYTVRTNAMPVSIADLNNIPLKYTNGPTVFLKDVGQVHDGLGRAAERRPYRRPALRVAERSQEWQRLDRRCCGRGPEGP